MPKSNQAENKATRLKYPYGRKCHVCGMVLDLEEFRFSTGTIYRSNCNHCNKLISVIANNHKKYKNDNAYCDRRIGDAKLIIRINELIIKHPEFTDGHIAKIINRIES